MWYIITKMDRKEKVIIIVGPTASGKSDLGIKIARKISAKGGPASGWQGAEIISADSRQVYRGMDIGTGKVPRDRIKIHDLRFKNGDSDSRFINRKSYISNGVIHHLIDVANPKKVFTASDFKRLGEKSIREITAKGKISIIVGGTGFYIDILLNRMQVAEVPPNPKLRARFNKLTAEHLYKMLQKLDPKKAEIIDRHNKHRIIRTLEIVLTTKKSSFNTKYSPLNTKYEVLWFGINPGKEMLAKRIKTRLDKRLCHGMIEEVAKLHNPPTGGGVSWKQLNSFGLEYRWVSRWLMENAKISARGGSAFGGKNDNEKIEKFKNSEFYNRLLTEIIKYSKRQMTWFKKNKEIHWIKDNKKTIKLIKKFIEI